jgi:sarcosine oxidase subunit beta
VWWTGAIVPGQGDEKDRSRYPPIATCRAYTAALRARGVQVCEGVPVQAITLAGGAVAGVTTPAGEVKAGIVVLAAGSGNPQRDRPGSGRDPPCAAIPGELPRQSLTAAAADQRCEPGQGRAPAPAVHPGDELSPQPVFDDVRFCLERAQRYFPGLGAVRLRRAWAGEIDATPDGLPVIDGGGGPGGLVIAAGMSGHGFGLAPVMGNIVADIAEGAEPGLDLRPFRIARFHEGSHLEPAHLM